MLNRRQTLTLLGAAALSSWGHDAATAPKCAEACERVRTYRRIRGRLDGAPVFVPYRGTVFGKIEGRAAVPLFDMEGFALIRTTAAGEDRFRLDSVDAGYFVDRESGEPLGRWTNPLNGLPCEVRHYRSFAHMRVSEAGLEPIESRQMPDASFTASMGVPTVMGGQVWVHEDLVGEFASAPRERFADPLEYFGPRLTATSLATWCAALADLADSERVFVPATLAYQTVGSWRPFMRMGSTPGVISTRMFGVKVETLDLVRPALRERVLRDYPDFLTRVHQDA